MRAPNLKAGIVRSAEFDQYSENLYVGGIPNLRIHGLIEMVLGLHRAPGCEADPAVCVQYGLGPVDGLAQSAAVSAAAHALVMSHSK